MLLYCYQQIHQGYTFFVNKANDPIQYMPFSDVQKLISGTRTVLDYV